MFQHVLFSMISNCKSVSYQIKTSHDIRKVSVQLHSLLHNFKHCVSVYCPEIHRNRILYQFQLLQDGKNSN